MGAITSYPDGLPFLATDTVVLDRSGDTYKGALGTLATIAGLAPTTNNFIVSVAGAWASRTPTQVKATLGLGSADSPTFGSVTADNLYTPATAGAIGPSGGNNGFIIYGASLGDQTEVKAAGASVVVFKSTGINSGADNARTLGSASFRFSTVYAGTGSINTSDEREKQQIGEVPDAWLDAWGNVQWVRYKFIGRTRWHLGAIAQQVRDAFAARELDAREIGLLCYDEWEAADPVEEVRGRDGEVSIPASEGAMAGERWGLRYDECFAMEAAWQRRELRRVIERLEGLEGI